MDSRARRFCLLAPAVIAGVLFVMPSAAFAGRLIATGHDADLHCAGGGSQCHYVEVAVEYVRAGSTKPVLVLDRGALQMNQALDDAFGQGVVPREVMDPRSPEFADADLSRYSAILVASDHTCGGCDLNTPQTETSQTPDSDAINARKGDIEAFFNAGGGIFAASGAAHGDGDPNTGPDTYYSFLPIPVGGKQVRSPFTLTPEGEALGFTDADVNCCATHNSFQEPLSGTALKVAERDSSSPPAPETLFAEGDIVGGEIVETPPPSQQTPSPPAATLSLTPATATRTVGESHVVMANAQNGHGTVRFFVNGAHFISGSTATNVSGDALFSYPSSIAGNDRIFAYLDRNGNGVQNSDEPSANATVSWSAPQQQPRDNPLPDNIPVADSIDDLPDPQPYQAANVQPVGRGQVFVRLPDEDGTASTSQASGAPKGFIPLNQAAQLPMGSILETSKGKVLVESTATNSSRTAQRAEFFRGRFEMLQRPLGRRSRPVTEMVIKGGGFRTRCASRRANAKSTGIQAQDARRRRGRVVRRLWGRGTGRFRTRGRYSSATVRGTTWVVQDHCGGTFTRLPRRPRNSRVQVEDLVQRRTVTLRAGHGYFAQPRSALRKR